LVQANHRHRVIILNAPLAGSREPMGVSDIVWQRAEMMQRTGHMVDAHIRAQFFYGPTGQVRTIPNNDGNGVLYANILSCVV
jgi:hypothetical protein